MLQRKNGKNGSSLQYNIVTVASSQWAVCAEHIWLLVCPTVYKCEIDHWWGTITKYLFNCWWYLTFWQLQIKRNNRWEGKSDYTNRAMTFQMKNAEEEDNRRETQRDREQKVLCFEIFSWVLPWFQWLCTTRTCFVQSKAIFQEGNCNNANPST